MLTSWFLTNSRKLAARRASPSVGAARGVQTVYQAVPYVGMAKVFDFIHVTNEVLTERGVALPLPGQSTTTPETREEKGLGIQKQIVGSDVVEKLYASVPADQQHIQRYLPANCFGDYLTRSGIDVPTRQLLTLSLLVALGGCDAQVKGHVAANLTMWAMTAQSLSTP